MKVIIVSLILLSTRVCAQYTYWTHDGASAYPDANVFSMGAILEDSTLRTIGTYVGSGTRGYQGRVKLSDGSTLSTAISDYFDYCYPSAVGFQPQSFIPMQDGGFITARTDVLPSGRYWARFIRFNSSLDTLWVKAYLQFNDPVVPSLENKPAFILPLSNDAFLSVCFADGSQSYRFCTHSMATGEVLTDHLWPRSAVYPDDTFYGLGIEGGVVTPDDSVFVWGGYWKDLILGERYQLFYAKFDLMGNLGSFYLDDPDGTGLEADRPGEAILKDGVITLFYRDGVSVQGEIYTPFTSRLKAKRLNANNLSFIEEIDIPFSTVDGVSLYDNSILNAQATQDGGFLVTMYIRPTTTTAIFYLLKINSEWALDWSTEIYPEFTGALNSELLVECPDRSIIVGGTLYPTLFDLPREYIIKLDACGYMVPSDCPEFVNVQEGSVVKDGFKLWPNPSSGGVDAIVPQGAKQLRVFDAQGRCVYQEPLYYPRQTWNLSGLPSGVYTFSVLDEHGTTWQQRWLKVE